MSDDIDGGKAHESVAFGLDGVGYEIDLHSKKAAALRKSLAEFVAGARRVPKSPFGQPAASRRSATKAKRSPEEPTPTQIREWAAATGLTVSPVGRISAAVREQYLTAQVS